MQTKELNVVNRIWENFPASKFEITPIKINTKVIGKIAKKSGKTIAMTITKDSSCQISISYDNDATSSALISFTSVDKARYYLEHLGHHILNDDAKWDELNEILNRRRAARG